MLRDGFAISLLGQRRGKGSSPALASRRRGAEGRSAGQSGCQRYAENQVAGGSALANAVTLRPSQSLSKRRVELVTCAMLNRNRIIGVAVWKRLADPY